MTDTARANRTAMVGPVCFFTRVGTSSSGASVTRERLHTNTRSPRLDRDDPRPRRSRVRRGGGRARSSAAGPRDPLGIGVAERLERGVLAGIAIIATSRPEAEVVLTVIEAWTPERLLEVAASLRELVERREAGAQLAG